MIPQQKKLLIASSSIDEAVTRTILNHHQQFDFKIDIILIHELLNDFNIFDELSDSSSIIRWFKPNQATLSNQTHLLLNRTLWMADDLFLNFVKQDREYAKREFAAYLGYSFSSFEGIGNQTVNGICDTFYSLPEQWHLLKNNQQLTTPEYYWGPPYLCHLSRNLVHSEIDNLYHWKTSPIKPQKNHGFCFEKPPGQPIFILMLGEQILFDANLKLSRKLQAEIRRQLKNIRACFGYFVFETLLFIKNNQIHFGCVNLNLTRAVKHPDFEAFIIKHFIPEFFKCLT
jgi:hypothetical protein